MVIEHGRGEKARKMGTWRVQRIGLQKKLMLREVIQVLLLLVEGLVAVIAEAQANLRRASSQASSHVAPT